MEQLESVLALNSESPDWHEILSTEEKKEIKIGLKQIAHYEFVSHQTIMEKFAKWH